MGYLGTRPGHQVVTAQQIADGVITTAKVVDGAVTTAKVADGAVTTAKVADANITAAKLAAGAAASNIGYTPANKAGDTYAGTHLFTQGLTVRSPTGGDAQITSSVTSIFTGSSGARYVHILLPDRYNQSNSKMFRLHIRGYALDITANRIIDCIVAGYVTSVSNGGPMSSVSVFDATGQYSPTVYYSSTLNKGVARIYLASQYYSTITVDAMQIGNGDAILPGEMSIQYSASATL